MSILVILMCGALVIGLFETVRDAYIVHCNQKKRRRKHFEVEYH